MKLAHLDRSPTINVVLAICAVIKSGSAAALKLEWATAVKHRMQLEVRGICIGQAGAHSLSVCPQHLLVMLKQRSEDSTLQMRRSGEAQLSLQFTQRTKTKTTTHKVSLVQCLTALG